MTTSSCKRFFYLPFLGGTETSCNHIKPYNDVVRSARKWYDITPLTSLPVFHRLHEDTSKVYNDGRPANPDVCNRNYRDIFSSNWFNFATYYCGLPGLYRSLFRIIVYVGLTVLLWKIFIRPLIGPSGVLIHTEGLRDDKLHESLLKSFFKVVNKLKIPRKVTVQPNIVRV